MEELLKNLPLLLPIIIIEFALAVFALIHIFKHPHYKFGSRPLWIVIVIFVGIIGPICYFVFGRDDED